MYLHLIEMSLRCELSIHNHSTVLVLLLLFRDALNDIFDMCDLTGNGLWSREEFRLFNLLTSDQELDDAEWQVVEGLSVSDSSLAIFMCFVYELCANLFLC